MGVRGGEGGSSGVIKMDVPAKKTASLSKSPIKRI